MMGKYGNYDSGDSCPGCLLLFVIILLLIGWTACKSCRTL